MVNYYVTKRNGKSIRFHRIVAEQKIGRKLLKEEIVHHINGNIRDNRPENLEITTPKKHSIYHNFKKRIQIKCHNCGKIILMREKLYQWKKNKNKNIYCSKECSGQKEGIKNLKYGLLYPDMEKVIVKELKKGKSLYRIAKEYKFNRYTVIFHFRKLREKNNLQLNPRFSRIKDGLYWCPKCKDYLPKNKFNKNKSTKIGIAAYCKICRKLEYNNHRLIV